MMSPTPGLRLSSGPGLPEAATSRARTGPTLAAGHATTPTPAELIAASAQIPSSVAVDSVRIGPRTPARDRVLSCTWYTLLPGGSATHMSNASPDLSSAVRCHTLIHPEGETAT